MVGYGVFDTAAMPEGFGYPSRRTELENPNKHQDEIEPNQQYIQILNIYAEVVTVTQRGEKE